MAICNYIKTTYRLIFLHSFKDGASGGEGRGAWRRKMQRTLKLNIWQQNWIFHVHGRKIDSIPVWIRKCLFFSFAFVTLYRCVLVTLFPIYVDSYAEKLSHCVAENFFASYWQGEFSRSIRRQGAASLGWLRWEAPTRAGRSSRRTWRLVQTFNNRVEL